MGSAFPLDNLMLNLAAESMNSNSVSIPAPVAAGGSCDTLSGAEVVFDTTAGAAGSCPKPPGGEG